MMTLYRDEWRREASLLRPAALTRKIFSNAPGPDPNRPWIPDTLLPLYGGESFAGLTAAQRLRYNHIYARQLLAEFVWLESKLICPPLLRLLNASRDDEDISSILRSFISDETNHMECFSILAKLAEEAEPPPVAMSLYRPPISVRAMAAMAARFPSRLSYWSSMIEPLERMAIKIGQTYMRDETVDPLFAKLFVTHARDEARHCRLDRLFGSWLRSKTSNSWNKFSDRYAATFLVAYYSGEWGLDRPLIELARVFPETAGEADRLIAETKALRSALPPPFERYE